MKIKNIINLSKLFISENIKHPELLKKTNERENSSFFWIVLVLFIAIILASNQLIDYFVRIGKPEIFLNIYSFYKYYL